MKHVHNLAMTRVEMEVSVYITSNSTHSLTGAKEEKFNILLGIVINRRVQNDTIRFFMGKL